MKKVAFFHSTMNTPLPLKQAFHARFPDTPLITVMDDSILPEVIENGGNFTPGIVRRLATFGTNVQLQGAAVAVCMCTTLTSAVAQAAQSMEIPFITIDGPMLEEAVTRGNKVALLITANTTLVASSRSAREAAVRAGRGDIQIDTILVEGAFDALNVHHDKALHDKLIVEAARREAQTHDVIALAQVSMVDAAKDLQDLPVPVLTSLKSGIDQIARYIEEA